MLDVCMLQLIKWSYFLGIFWALANMNIHALVEFQPYEASGGDDDLSGS